MIRALSDTALSPTLFLERAARSFPERCAVKDGVLQLTYRGLSDRAQRLAGAFHRSGIRDGDRVAALCTNSHNMLELHYGAALAGAVLVPLNIRLSEAEIVYMLQHSGTSLLVADQELVQTARSASSQAAIRLVETGDDSEYEQLLENATPLALRCEDENKLLSISYTSGSTGRPKGVMYSHRGAYLQGLAMAHHSKFGTDSVYLWTLPMFHCNGWACTWAVTACGGIHYCLRRVDAVALWQTICTGGVTHLSGAPTLLTMIADAADSAPSLRPSHPLAVATGGAPPTPILLERLRTLDMHVTHFYGLTETYGPAVVNEWQPEWSTKSRDVQARLNARQGVANIASSEVTVLNAAGNEVPPDGQTLGEVALRGSNVMLGYFRDEDATRAVTREGWFRSGDLGVRHPDGYIELKDRIKDIIVSGGENISSIEVEQVLSSHPAVSEAAVVAKSDPRWGEVPVAFIDRRDDFEVSDEALIAHVRQRLAHFKAPKAIVFGPLPKTSTGKVQKNVLRAALCAPDSNVDT